MVWITRIKWCHIVIFLTGELSERVAKITGELYKVETLAWAVETNLVSEFKKIFPVFQLQRSFQNQIYWDSITINSDNNTIHLKEISSTMELHSSLCNENECYDFQKNPNSSTLPKVLWKVFPRSTSQTNITSKWESLCTDKIINIELNALPWSNVGFESLMNYFMQCIIHLLQWNQRH